MDSAATLHRLLHALETLGVREDEALAEGDGAAFLALEQRAEPLVRRVAELAERHAPLTPALRTRGAALITSRAKRGERLSHLIEHTRSELGRLNEARSRVHAFRPAYAGPAVRPQSSFAACG